MHVTLTRQELWLIHAVLRHEIPQIGAWELPPAGKELAWKIIEGLLFCEENSQKEALLDLTARDCWALDFVVPQDAKDFQGNNLGQDLLIKIWQILRNLEEGEIPLSDFEGNSWDQDKSKAVDLYLKAFDLDPRRLKPQKEGNDA